MAISAYPFDDQDISEAQFGALQGTSIATGIAAAPGTNHFKITATGSNMVLSATAVGGNSLAIVRGHAVVMTTDTTATVAAADATARVDLVVLRLNYATNSITPVILKGTAGSSVPPAPSWGAGGFYDLPLATVAVGGSVLFITQANVTDVRRFSGTTPGAWTTASRPATPLTIGYNLTDSRWEFTLDGTTYAPLSVPDLSGAGVSGILPIAKGGTGQVDAVAALQALGIYVQTAQPAYAAGRVWIKIPA